MWITSCSSSLGFSAIGRPRYSWSTTRESPGFEAIRELSLTDSLTKLHNRRYFWEVAPGIQQRRQRSQTPFTVAMIDIDHFKRINDTYGHGAGDLVLVQVAGILSAMFAREDVICRFGGGEFCVLSTSIDRAAARNRFAELRRRIQATIVDVGHAEAKSPSALGSANARPHPWKT